VQRLQLLHLFLEDVNVVHEGYNAVGRHGGGVEAGGGQEWGHMEGHGALGSIEDEELAPGEPQQGHLVGDLQVGEEGNIAGPLDGAEEQTGGQLTDVLDAHDVVGLHALAAVAGGGVGLGPQQEGDVS
ncbi:hypothetical protein N302_05767, partial [Corvus brachyrhynchos]